MNQNRWPDGRQAAVSITLDNMGEAAELYRGTWPETKTVGLHHSVTESLPAMMTILNRHDVRVTYFIEGWNTGVYDGAIQAFRNGKHEVACHGWQHEPWSSLDPEIERDLLDRSLNGFGKLGLTIRGFRPPGGVLTNSTASLLADRDFSYCSPAGADAAVDESVVYLPFDWQGIDAYYYSDGFSGLRAAKGDPEATLSPEDFVQRVSRLIDARLETGGYTALLFHPFLEIGAGRREAMNRIIERVANDQRIWCAPGEEIARWVREDQSLFGDDPGFDTTSWTR